MEAVAEKPKASRAMQAQPLEIVNISGARLNVRTVELLIDKSKAWILRETKAGKFPRGIRESATSTIYLADDIRAYLDVTKQGIEWSPEAARNLRSNFYSNSDENQRRA